MKKVLTYKGAVMTWECDSNRHMNVMYYINKYEHAGRHSNIELGINDLGSNSNIGIVVLEQQVKYMKEVFEDELLHIETSLLEINNKAFTVFHEMYNTRTKERVSTMKVVLVLFDKIERKALPFPEERKKALGFQPNATIDMTEVAVRMKPRKRLIKVAKELDIGTADLAAFLNGIGYKIEDKPTAKVSDAMYEAIIKAFGKGDNDIIEA